MNIQLFFVIFLFSSNVIAQEKKVKIYPFKSAIIEYKYEASLAGTHIKYIDDYGYKQAAYIKKELSFGGNTEKEYETIILIGAKAYTINLQDSIISVGRNSTYTYYLENQDKVCTDVTEAILMVAYGYELNGTEKYLKKDCKVWKSGNSKMLMWNGLELKSENNFMMMTVKKAVKIKIDKKIPVGVFDIPQGIKYISSDVYQGFSGLELTFENTDSISENNDNHIVGSFSTSKLEGSNNFKYFTSEDKDVLLEGVNDYNKIDSRLIRSQQFAMANGNVILRNAETLIFETEDGDFGKMQLKQIDKNGFEFRYAIFNSDGTINSYSNETSELLNSDFSIVPDNDNNYLIISPKGEVRCFNLGY